MESLFQKFFHTFSEKLALALLAYSVNPPLLRKILDTWEEKNEKLPSPKFSQQSKTSLFESYILMVINDIIFSDRWILTKKKNNAYCTIFYKFYFVYIIQKHSLFSLSEHVWQTLECIIHYVWSFFGILFIVKKF